MQSLIWLQSQERWKIHKKFEGRSHGKLGLYGKMLLKWTLKKWDMAMWIRFNRVQIFMAIMCKKNTSILFWTLPIFLNFPIAAICGSVCAVICLRDERFQLGSLERASFYHLAVIQWGSIIYSVLWLSMIYAWKKHGKPLQVRKRMYNALPPL
jgi:hypothetical protein